MKVKAGELVADGKTKTLSRIVGVGDVLPDDVLLVKHKDDITAGDGAKHSMVEGKGVVACQTTVNTFALLETAGIRTHQFTPPPDFRLDLNQMMVRQCDMIKLEVVARRVATGSYLTRNLHIEEGVRFVPLVTELFLKDDDRHDPMVEFDPSIGRWVYWAAGEPKNSQTPMLLEQGFGLLTNGVGENWDHKVVEKLPEMRSILIDVFEVLEEAWHRLGVQLVDLKIEFGFTGDGTLVVGDVIDNDSWRIWPDGDKRLQLDKQVFRELDEATAEEMTQIRQNYQKVSELTGQWLKPPPCVVKILAGSKSDDGHVDEIVKNLSLFGLTHTVDHRSADKTPEELRALVQDADRMGANVVYIAVAGRRNALGGMDIHTPNLLINCPPLDEAEYAVADLLSSLRMPSGFGAVTVMYPEAAAIAAAKHLARLDLMVWCKLREYQRKVREKVLS